MKYRARIVFSERNPVYKGIVERSISYIMLNYFLFFTGACKRCRCRSSGKITMRSMSGPEELGFDICFLYLWMDGWLVLPGSRTGSSRNLSFRLADRRFRCRDIRRFKKIRGQPEFRDGFDSAKTKHLDGMRNLSPSRNHSDLLSGT